MSKEDLDLDRRAQRVREELKPFFTPENIAVIGASREKETIGWSIFRTLLERKREGKLKTNIYGVNIKNGRSLGKKLYKSILDIEENVEHAIFSIPAKHVPKAMEEAGKKGVKAATIISAGFSEIGNVELEKKVEKVAKDYGVRVMGPNCMGIYDPYDGMDTLFTAKYKERNGEKLLSSPRPKKGFITFFSQSGALGVATLDYMYGQEMGISKFISAGNMIDIDEEDALLYAFKDPQTRVISLYIEGLKDGRKVIKIGKEITKKKPIVVLKGGQTQAGARATKSHTASLAGNYRLYLNAFKQMGAIMTEDLVDFIDFQKALALQPPARGEKIGIITNGGGAGILSTDEAERMGLKVPPFEEEAMEKFNQLINEGILPEVSTFANPCDLTGSGDTKAYSEATKVLLEDENFDAVLIIALHHPPTITLDLSRKLYEVSKDYKKPIVMANFGTADAAKEIRDDFTRHGVPAYSSPERGMSGLGALVQYGEYLKSEGELERYLAEYEKPKI